MNTGNKKLNLSNVTLYSLCWGEDYVKNTLRSMCICNDACTFNDITLLCPMSDIGASSYIIESLGVNIVNISPMKNFEYSDFFVTQIGKYIKGDFCLNVQPDSTIIDISKWDNEFYNYDYIGSPWHSANGFVNNVGNGGFSFRSRKLLEESSKLVYNKHHPNPLYGCAPEDWFICIKNYYNMINKGVKFAPTSVACKFSVEHSDPYVKIYNPELLSSYQSLGFHGEFNKAGMEYINSYEKKNEQ
jgi:hypothetical protein